MHSSLYQATVFCTLQVEGVHHWPGCPYEEVDYLRVPHRHVFHVKAFKKVEHNDRDVEFIMLKHQILEYFKQFYDDQRKLYVFGAMSCEMIGAELMTRYNLTQVEVSEDNENGAVLTHTEVAR